MSNRFDLSGQTALVTGASRGIGAALAVGLAEAGADLVLAARTLDALDEVAGQVRALGREATTVPLDVREALSIDALAGALAGRPPTILVNNAGAEAVMPALEVTPENWDTIVGTNLKGAFFVAQAFARALVAAGQPGVIVNVCSLSSERGIPAAIPYTSSKSGLAGMTRALAAEWARHGIRVNGLGPGYFHTELTAPFYADPAWREAMLGKIPMRRLGELDDLVGATIFLASPASAYMTGQIVYVDGGYLASI